MSHNLTIRMICTLTIGCIAFIPVSATAQDHNYVPGFMNTYNMMRHVTPDNPRDDRRSNRRNSRTPRIACSADSLPPAEKRRMNLRVAQIWKSHGKKAAVAYARKQGMAYHRKLKAQGICP